MDAADEIQQICIGHAPWMAGSWLCPIAAQPGTSELGPAAPPLLSPKAPPMPLLPKALARVSCSSARATADKPDGTPCITDS